MRGLRLFNALMVPVHLVQGLLMLALSTDFSLPVTTSFLKFDEAAEKLVTDDNTLFDLRLGPAVASFLFVSALAHLIITLPGVYQWYERNLGRGINYARWFEYSVSASIMIVVISMLVGVYDLGSLILVFTRQRRHDLLRAEHGGAEPGRGASELDTLRARMFGRRRAVGRDYPLSDCAGLSVRQRRPYIRLRNLTFRCSSSSTSLAVNMLLQYRRVGPWRDYLFGERVYILLSLTAKSALAWQVFAGTLRDV